MIARVNNATVACTKAFANAIAAAKAVNSLLHLSATDQESLLAVGEEYFTSPGDDLDEPVIVTPTWRTQMNLVYLLLFSMH